jgi:predicted DNA-binding WGR domain protein
MLYWERHDHDQNQHHWYCVTFDHDLLGDLVLVKSWGNIGRRGTRKEKQVLQSADDLRACLQVIGEQREADGYAVAGVGWSG